MKPTQWRKVKEIYHAATARPADQWAAFLDEACAGDPELRSEAASLLACHDQAEGFLEEGSTDRESEPCPDDGQDDLTGAQVGAYSLVREIGQGGMGVVFLAQRADGQFQRQAAIKVVRQGLETPFFTRRFLRERQILADLNHPNIARLLDGGAMANGRPYLVMEYVPGQPITDYCDRRRLSLDERLRLFQKVCRAVHHAHQRLVIHRDLKPSNILITERGEPKLLDFGAAKLLEPETSGAAAATAGVRMMTPAYASPEQLRGEPIGTAADVYALGVVFYELLTGRTPHRPESASVAAWTPSPREWEPEKPSSVFAKPGRAPAERAGAAASASQARSERVDKLRRRLKGDLDTMALTALRQDPAKRYASAQQFAEEIDRYLSGMPVMAQPDAWRYRARKFVRRNRVVLAVACLATLSLLGGMAATLWQARVAFAERSRAQRHLAEAERQKAFAETQSIRGERVSQFMVDLFKLADPNRSKGETVTVREALDRGAEKIMRELENQPEVKAEMLAAISQAYQNLGLFDQALPLLAEAVAARRRLPDGDKRGLADSLHQLGWASYQVRDYLAAESWILEGLAVRRQWLDEADPAFAESVYALAVLHHAAGEYALAEGLYRESLARFSDSDHGDRPKKADILVELGELMVELGRFEEAETLLCQGLEMHLRLFGDERVETISALNAFAALKLLVGNHAAAERWYARALAAARTLFGEEHGLIAVALEGMADLRRLQGDAEAAEALYRQSLDMRRRLFGEDSLEVAGGLSRLGLARERMRDFEAAADFHVRSLVVFRRILGAGHPHVGVTLSNLGYARYMLGDMDAAERRYREALAVARACWAAPHREIWRASNGLAYTLAAGGRFLEAVPLYHEAWRTIADLEGAAHGDALFAMNALAVNLHEAGDYDRAIGVYRDYLKLASGRDGEPSVLTATVTHNLAESLRRNGEFEQAEPLYRRALTLRQKLLPADHVSVADSLVMLGSLLSQRESWREAEPLLRRGLAIRRQKLGEAHWLTAYAGANLGVCLTELESYEEAEIHLSESMAAMERARGSEDDYVRQLAARLVSLYQAWGKPGDADRFKAKARMSGDDRPRD